MHKEDIGNIKLTNQNESVLDIKVYALQKDYSHIKDRYGNVDLSPSIECKEELDNENKAARVEAFKEIRTLLKTASYWIDNELTKDDFYGDD